MTTIELIQKAKDEIESAITAKNTIFGKTLDTPEYQFSRMGRAAALLEVAIAQIEDEDAPIDCEDCADG